MTHISKYHHKFINNDIYHSLSVPLKLIDINLYQLKTSKYRAELSELIGLLQPQYFDITLTGRPCIGSALF